MNFKKTPKQKLWFANFQKSTLGYESFGAVTSVLVSQILLQKVHLLFYITNDLIAAAEDFAAGYPF